MKSPRIWWRSSRWWAWACLLSAVAGFALKTIGPEPFWWQRWMGAQLLSQGQLPPGTPTYPGWGGLLLLAWLGQTGGLLLLHLVRSIVAGLTLWLVLRQSWARSRNWRATAIAVACTASCGLALWDVSSELWALPLLALAHFILTQVSLERWPRRALIGVPLLALLWANLAVGVGAVVALAGLHALGALIDRHQDRVDAPTYPTMQALAWTAAASALIILLNPQGWRIIQALVSELLAPLNASNATRWQLALNNLRSPVSQVLLLWVIVGAALVIVLRQQLRSADLLSFGLFATLALLAYTFGGGFPIIAAPIIAEALMRRGRLKLIKRSAEATPLAVVLTSVAAGLALIWQPLWADALPRPGAAPINTPFARADLANPLTAVDAFEQLLKQPPTGAVFTGADQASYGLWRSSTQPDLLNDPRTGVAGPQQRRDMASIASGTYADTLLNKYSINHVLVTAQQPELLKAMGELPGWHAGYTDAYSIIFERTTPQE